MPYTAKYIAFTDITDKVVADFLVSGSEDASHDIWMENTDLEIEQVALERGVYSTSIYLIPLGYRIKEYAIAYLCFLVCQDCFGVNDVEVEQNETYLKKLEYYKNRCELLKSQITKEMFLNTAQSLTPVQMVQTGILYRA
jgi:hypothetical protein